MPASRIALIQSGGGKPKWKLTTFSLAASRVTDVHVFGRRGPAQVKFTPLELRELGELRDVDMVVYEEDFDYDDASKAAIASNKQVMVIDRVLQSWRQRPSADNRARVQSPQNGWVTDAITPISPAPSR